LSPNADIALIYPNNKLTLQATKPSKTHDPTTTVAQNGSTLHTRAQDSNYDGQSTQQQETRRDQAGKTASVDRQQLTGKQLKQNSTKNVLQPVVETIWRRNIQKSTFIRSKTKTN